MARPQKTARATKCYADGEEKRSHALSIQLTAGLTHPELASRLQEHRQELAPLFVFGGAGVALEERLWMLFGLPQLPA